MITNKLIALGAFLALFSFGHAGLAGRPVKLSAYNAVPAQTDATPHLSACGRTRPSGVQVAVSRDLLRQYPCGTWLHVYRPDTERWHRYQVWDTLSARKSNQVDILMPTLRAAVKFGIQRGRVRPE